MACKAIVKVRQASRSVSSMGKPIALASSKANLMAFDSFGFDYIGFRTINSAAESP